MPAEAGMPLDGVCGDMGNMWVGILGLLLLLLCGVMLVVFGVRGARVGDHPVCCRCGFDLFGMPSGVSICSECGSDVSRRGAIRIGHRKRKAGSILVGIVLLLGFCCFAGFWGWQSSQNINWEAHLPTFWLIHETASSDALTRDPALAELLRRMRAGNLSDGDIQSLVVRGLAIQADTSKTWVSAWGDIIEAAHRAGKLPGEEWRQYALNAADLQLSARPRVRRGDSGVPLRIYDGRGRVGNASTLCVETDGGDSGSDLAAGNQDHFFDGTSGLTNNGGGWMGTTLKLDPALLAKAPLGPKFARMKLKLRLFPGFQLAEGTAAPIAERTITLKAPWELVAADAPTVQPINDEKYRAAVTRSLKVGECWISASQPYTSCEVNIDCTGSPVPLAYNVFLRASGREFPAGSVNFSPGLNGNSDFGTGQSCPKINADHVDVILRPSAEVCASTIDLTSFWNGEITFTNVPLKHR